MERDVAFRCTCNIRTCPRTVHAHLLFDMLCLCIVILTGWTCVDFHFIENAKILTRSYRSHFSELILHHIKTRSSAFLPYEMFNSCSFHFVSLSLRKRTGSEEPRPSRSRRRITALGMRARGRMRATGRAYEGGGVRRGEGGVARGSRRSRGGGQGEVRMAEGTWRGLRYGQVVNSRLTSPV